MHSPLTQPCAQPLVPIINRDAAILRRQQLACVKPIHNTILLAAAARRSPSTRHSVPVDSARMVLNYPISQ